MPIKVCIVVTDILLFIKDFHKTLTKFLPRMQACADKLTNELKEFGFPPVFPREEVKEEEEESPDLCDPTKRPKKVGTRHFRSSSDSESVLMATLHLYPLVIL